MINRDAANTLSQLAKGFPVLGLTGPRQSGKTTLVRALFSDKPYVSLENPDERNMAAQDPKGFLGRFPQGAIFDEIQREPNLLSYLQGIVDERRRMGEFVVTSSQQFGLMQSITQSLAGRIGLVQLLPLALTELRRSERVPTSLDNVMYTGLYPALYDRELMPAQWFANYLATYIERDVRQIADIRDLSLFQRFVKLCAARCGQLLNLTSLANDSGISHTTARAWISILEAGYIVFLLTPYHRNFGKRLVKMPKLYFYDVGLASYLLGIQNPEQLSIHAQRGALFETFVIAEYVKNRFNQGQPMNLYFWRNNTGEEIDLLVEQGTQVQPIEIKSGQTFHSDFTASLRKWMGYADTDLYSPRVVYGGNDNFQFQGIEVVSWRGL